VAHLLHPRLDLWVDEAPSSGGVLQERHDALRQQVVGLADVSIVAQDPGAQEVAVVSVVVLDGVEDDRHARVLAPDGDRSLDAVHLVGQLHVHQHRVQ
jgi:hypothetical protein